MIGMLVGDDDGVERGWIFIGKTHTPEELAAAQAGVDQDPGLATGDDGAIAFGSRRQNCESDHEVRIPRKPVQYEAGG